MREASYVPPCCEYRVSAHRLRGGASAGTMSCGKNDCYGSSLRLTSIRIGRAVQANFVICKARANKKVPRLQTGDLSREAGNRIRTDDLLITNQLLYLLSYSSSS